MTAVTVDRLQYLLPDDGLRDVKSLVGELEFAFQAFSTTASVRMGLDDHTVQTDGAKEKSN